MRPSPGSRFGLRRPPPPARCRLSVHVSTGGAVSPHQFSSNPSLRAIFRSANSADDGGPALPNVSYRKANKDVFKLPLAVFPSGPTRKAAKNPCRLSAGATSKSSSSATASRRAMSWAANSRLKRPMCTMFTVRCCRSSGRPIVQLMSGVRSSTRMTPSSLSTDGGVSASMSSQYRKMEVAAVRSVVPNRAPFSFRSRLSFGTACSSEHECPCDRASVAVEGLVGRPRRPSQWRS